MNPEIKDEILNDNENDCVIPSETRNLLQSTLPFNTVKPCHIERSRDTYTVGYPLEHSSSQLYNLCKVKRLKNNTYVPMW